jgi:hypothetical protein
VCKSLEHAAHSEAGKTALDFAEQALAAQQRGDDGDAERLFGQKSELDPDAVAQVLRVTGADAVPDSREARTDRMVDYGTPTENWLAQSL